LSIGLVGDIGSTLQRLIADGIIPDAATDQTSPMTLSMAIYQATTIAKLQPSCARKTLNFTEKNLWKAWQDIVNALLEMKKSGAVVFEYGNNLRQFAKEKAS